MNKCGLYLRVSTDIQAETKDGSLDTQDDLLRKYCELKTATDTQEWIVAKVYREEGKSGKDVNRPEFQRMVKDIKSGKINTVMCTKLDRISRSLIDFNEFHQLLQEHDVTFISLNEQFDSSTSSGRLGLNLMLSFAQWEREQTSDRTKEKMKWRAEQGLSNGGQILGYDLDPESKGIPIPSDEEASLVNLVFTTYIEVKSFLQVAVILNKKGYRTKFYTSRRGKVQGGKKFTDTSIRRILTNAYYIGKVVHRGNEYDGKHEPIVSVELYQKVQKIIKSNTESRSRRRKQNLHPFILQGLVRCSMCDSFMTPYYGFNRNRVPYFYYACTKNQHQGKAGCSMSPVSAPELERVVAKRLMQLKSNETLIERIVSDSVGQSSETLEGLMQTRDRLVRNQTEVARKIETLVESLADGAGGVKSISQKIVELEEQKEQMELEGRELEGGIAEIKKKVANAQTLKDTLTTFSELYTEATPTEKKELLRLHINKVIWSPQEICIALFECPTENVLTTSAIVQSVSLSGSDGRTRTYDPVVNSHLLCRLSYVGTLKSGRQEIYKKR